MKRLFVLMSMLGVLFIVVFASLAAPNVSRQSSVAKTAAPSPVPARTKATINRVAPPLEKMDRNCLGKIDVAVPLNTLDVKVSSEDKEKIRNYLFTAAIRIDAAKEAFNELPTNKGGYIEPFYNDCVQITNATTPAGQAYGDTMTNLTTASMNIKASKEIVKNFLLLNQNNPDVTDEYRAGLQGWVKTFDEHITAIENNLDIMRKHYFEAEKIVDENSTVAWVSWGNLNPFCEEMANNLRYYANEIKP